MIEFLNSLSILKWSTGGGIGIVSPVAYIAGSAPYYETSWRVSLDLSEPLLSCAKTVSWQPLGAGTFKLGFKVFLKLKEKKVKNIEQNITFKVFDIENEEKVPGLKEALENWERGTWRLNFEDLTTVTLNFPIDSWEWEGFSELEGFECQDSKIKQVTKDIGGYNADVDVSTIRFRIDKHKCTGGAGIRNVILSFLRVIICSEWVTFNQRLNILLFS